MERITLKGLTLSRFVAGYWHTLEWDKSAKELLGYLEAHLDLGISACDHADIYGDYQCEQRFGEALKLKPQLRQQLQLITKTGVCLPGSKGFDLPHYNNSAGHIVHQVEQSLRHFATDYLDLLLIHRPDPLMNADEVADAFNQLHQSGKVRHFGVANFKPSQFDLLQSRLSLPLITNQLAISPLQMNSFEDGTLDHLQQRRITPMAWSCLGGGRLFSPEDPQARQVRLELQQIKQEIGAGSIEQVLYAWVLALPSKPLPILGSGDVQQLHHAVASQQLALTREHWYRIWSVANGQRLTQ